MEARIIANMKCRPETTTPAIADQYTPSPADDLWAKLEEVQVDRPRSRRSRILTWSRSDPAHISFDVLRTKVLRSLRQNKWTTVAITSPEPGCGKSVVAANLAFSLANIRNRRTVLMDLDLRRPHISNLLGQEIVRPTYAFLEGMGAMESAFVRYGDNLAVSASRSGVRFPSELLQSELFRTALVEVRNRLQPDVLLLDLPPVLGSDDVLALLPNVDCTLLVVGAGLTTVAQVRRCEQELANQTNLLGMVLNKCKHVDTSGYY